MRIHVRLEWVSNRIPNSFKQAVTLVELAVTDASRRRIERAGSEYHVMDLYRAIGRQVIDAFLLGTEGSIARAVFTEDYGVKGEEDMAMLILQAYLAKIQGREFHLETEVRVVLHNYHKYGYAADGTMLDD